MQTFNLSSLVTESEKGCQRWREFLRVPALSMGLYRLKVGQTDEQESHTEDEEYLVISGKAFARACAGCELSGQRRAFCFKFQAQIRIVVRD
jgi:hypothetical protein